jgi:hypothetical protein
MTKNNKTLAGLKLDEDKGEKAGCGETQSSANSGLRVNRNG